MKATNNTPQKGSVQQTRGYAVTGVIVTLTMAQVLHLQHIASQLEDMCDLSNTECNMKNFLSYILKDLDSPFQDNIWETRKKNILLKLIMQNDQKF